MDEKEKPKLQINQKQLDELCVFLKPGIVLPVAIEKQISANYYAVRIKNVLLNAFSEVDLRSKDAFVRVIETKPIPRLQLLFSEKNSMLTMLSEQELTLDYAEYVLLNEAYPYLPKGKEQIEPEQMQVLLDLLAVKTQFQIIQLSLFFNSSLSFIDLMELYSMKYLKKESGKVKRSVEGELLNAFNESIAHAGLRLEQWEIPVSENTLLLPVETVLQGDNLSRLSSCLFTKNFGQININGQKSAGWTVNIDFENQIYQRNFIEDFNSLKKRLDGSIKEEINLKLGVMSAQLPDNMVSLFDKTINN
ncbi:MAG TPA: hypothetical protein PL063_08535 [Candidatus Cloacimonadota bacterium]|nr:hypothetical protein [Candidatus Cloacimonadota bacterium]HOQ80391.1 hypothetical protein [Candidatus Cloacimonadota bacterium]HPY97246.1 hypothetical protein [Candidatus Cloacimonadota bacterium]HQB41764.1 hypothetical protein [Candidatus Cloacimonadota bacterium]